jgi:hypothetical protein
MDGEPHASAGEPAVLDHEVVGGAARTTALFPGETWTVGRSRTCSETLTLPALSRVALLVQHLEQGRLRLVARQSGTGRVHVSADDLSESHALRLGSAPVVLGPGNYTVKVELPPVVLRAALAVPQGRDTAEGSATPHGIRVHGTTAHAWVPLPGDPGEDAWIAVAALAVTVSRYPELYAGSAGQNRLTDRLRTAVTVWCGHGSTYWVNERLKEAVAAADLEIPDNSDRLSRVVAHYAQVFPDATVRGMRDHLRAVRPDPTQP